MLTIRQIIYSKNFIVGKRKKLYTIHKSELIFEGRTSYLKIKKLRIDMKKIFKK